MPDQMASLKALLRLQAPQAPQAPFAGGNGMEPIGPGLDEAHARTSMGASGYDQARSTEDRLRADEIEDEQRQEVAAIHNAQLGAHMEGFESPQQRAGYGRQVEQQKIQAPIEAARASGAAGMDRLIASQNGQDGRTQAVIRGEAERQQNALAAKRTTTPVPYQQMKALTDSKTAYESPLNGLVRKVGANGGRREYENALTAVLDRKGDLGDLTKIASGLQQYPGSIDDKINAANSDDAFPYDLSSLDDLHRAYLNLKLGQ